MTSFEIRIFQRYQFLTHRLTEKNLFVVKTKVKDNSNREKDLPFHSKTDNVEFSNDIEGLL